MQSGAVRDFLVAANFGVSKSEKTTKDNPAGFSEGLHQYYLFQFHALFHLPAKRQCFISFRYQIKRVVVFHWLPGFMVYVSFLAFSKAGSVLHKLRVCVG